MSNVLRHTIKNTNHRHQGFTLLEVLVALAVLAIVMGALIKVTDSYAFNAGYLQEKTLAQWIAENKAVEYQLMQEFPPVGSKEGETEMAKVDWQWRVKVSNTDDKRLRRLDISVALKQGDLDTPITTLVAFVGQPL
ncbi:MAG: type II secretion system minor pseudopilin GspI [Halobacteria archaeon]|nr:type II secretion system minor pseudopilin GspI [Halobacteria archaeon]